ncbi:MAG: hypothetical protein AB7O24_03450 [Kofleriaceae bacterium]
MKKCASCSKDLPDAALHCVFCGAKQAPASASANKTVMGYQASDVLEQIRRQQAAGQPGPPTGAPPVAAPRPGASAPPPMAPPPMAQPHLGPPQGHHPGYVAPAPAHAATMLAPPNTGFPGPQAGPSGYAHPMGQHPMGQPSAFPPSGPQPYPQAPPPAYVAPAPAAAIPSVIPAYQASQPSAQAGRPIEPWKDSLRLVQVVWGGLLLVAFVMPRVTEPSLVFGWTEVIDGQGLAKLPALVMAVVGLLSVLLGILPVPTVARGAIGGALALVGIFVTPLAMKQDWQLFVYAAGFAFMVIGLLLRHEYREALLPRILVTIAAIAIVLPSVIPDGDRIELVESFKALINGPIKGYVLANLIAIFLAVLAVLAWLPSPSGGLAKPLLWLFIAWPFVLVAMMFIDDASFDVITKAPYIAASWIAGSGLGAAYLAIAAYAGATVIGKQLE